TNNSLPSRSYTDHAKGAPSSTSSAPTGRTKPSQGPPGSPGFSTLSVTPARSLGTSGTGAITAGSYTLSPRSARPIAFAADGATAPLPVPRHDFPALLVRTRHWRPGRHIPSTAVARTRAGARRHRAVGTEPAYGGHLADPAAGPPGRDVPVWPDDDRGVRHCPDRCICGIRG